MVTRILLLACLATSPLAAQVEVLPPRPLGPLAPRPMEPTPLTVVDPYADARPTLLPAVTDDEGLFLDSELALAFPTLIGKLPAGALSIPQADLDATFASAYEIGYRLPDCQGLFGVTYRFLNADGVADFSGGAAGTAIGGAARTRASLNVIDIDYGSPTWEIAPRWTASWRAGARIAGLYSDSRWVNGNTVRQASNHYFGSGGHGRVELERRLPVVPGLSLFGRVDGAVLIGRSQQRYRVENTGRLDFVDRESRTVPVVTVLGGVTYEPPAWPKVKVTLGYAYEEWFKAGSLGMNRDGTIATSEGGLRWHGPVLWAQYDF